MSSPYKSPLHETVATTPTDYWNDSCSIQELTYAIEHGATGATTNPTIVLDVLNKEMDRWRDRILQMISEYPDWSEEQLAWKLFEEVSVRGAELLLPVFKRERGLKGRLSIQTNPAYHRNWKAIVEHAEHFEGLASNMQVKILTIKAGI